VKHERLLREVSPGRTPVSLAITLIAQTPESTLDQLGELLSSAIDSLIQGRCLVNDRHGLAALEAGFHHATHIVIAALLVAILIAQVDLHSRDVIAASA